MATSLGLPPAGAPPGPRPVRLTPAFGMPGLPTPPPRPTPAFGAPAGVPGLPLPGSQASIGIAAAGSDFEVLPISRGERRRLERKSWLPWTLCVLLAGGSCAGGVWAFVRERRLAGATTAALAGREAIKQERDAALALVEQGKATLLDLQQKVVRFEEKAAESAAAGASSAATRKEVAESTAALAEALRAELVGHKVPVVSDSDTITVSLDEGVLFAAGKSEISLDGYRVLYRLSKVLKDIHNRKILVGGYTDAPRKKPAKGKGGKTVVTSSGWDLAAARAVGVARFFVEDLKLEAKRVAVTAPAPTPPKNKRVRVPLRRVDIVLAPV